MVALLPRRRAVVRPLVLALCALLGACAGPLPEPAPPAPPAGWRAAIGSLEVTGLPEICTAVLVRADLIATTSHCLHPRGRSAAAEQFVFTSSILPAVQAHGVEVLARGGDVVPGNIGPKLAQIDWALIRIAPPINKVGPIPLASISPAMARVEIARGAEFYSAGYGQGAKDQLRKHERCGLLPPDPNGVTEGELFFTTNCVIRLGDSGGPVILVEGGQPKLIGLIVGFARHPKTDQTMGLVVSAKAFASYVGTGLVSQLFPLPAGPEFPMN
jgi:hypothetical protein